jgi:dinuclear metal center YbgI/SA1388 family protein
MKIKEVTHFLESIAPPIYQEGYDNSGLIIGNPQTEVTGILCCLDSVEAVVEEAIEKKCNLIIAHHPIIFKGLKRLNGKNYIERVVIKAIQNNIAIYAIHTNLDNMLYQGVNTQIAVKLGLEHTRILAPKKNLKKLFAFAPTESSDALRNALFQAGAGAINGWQHLSYATVGAGTANGQGLGRVKLELLFPKAAQSAITKVLEQYAQSEKVVYDIVTVENTNYEVGSGMVGELPKAMKETQFLKYLKEKMNVSCIRHTALRDKPIKKVAFCGGAGGFLLRNACAVQADIFVTADYKYHEFFDADGQIIIADIGHYESEQYTIQLLYEVLTKKISNFAVYCTEVNTNPIQYFS